MRFPLGDIIRALAKPGSWLARIFSKTKGISIGVGGHEVALDREHGFNEGAGPARPGESSLDSRPHRPAPPRPPGR